eukprot:14402712-Alexandrium_andersonii.AAC.1
MAEEQALKSLVCDRVELRRIRSQEGPVGGAFCVRMSRVAVELASGGGRARQRGVRLRRPRAARSAPFAARHSPLLPARA